MQRQNLVVAVLIFLSVGFARGAPFKTSEKRIPSEVREAIAKQIKAFFKTDEISGVPLLDPKIDWNEFGNWPEEFAFRGETYTPRLIKGTQIVGQRISRAEAKVGLTFCANYRLKDSDDRGRLHVSAVWLEDGLVQNKSVRMYKERYPGAYDNYVKRKSEPNIRSSLGDQYHTIFASTFYRTGDLYRFDRSQGGPKFDGTTEYFDRSGKVVGVVDHYQAQWEGRKVDGPTFYRLAAELFKSDAPPQR